ncbi:MAG: hypothetical protein MK211_06225 [Flavobacteriales bacterium]|jgi:hypothetical protein|uniref:hypothetical protein n=1 Tax=Candidatus Ulvibacter alkanivorans TaxID=2267620 RepID=UPI000DF193D0|nr:hypothetical protein [Candidatus Ulvibacter alkanivorans]MCH2489731.1 hypothetical protein [Flavobacteriales bacterium]
MKDRVKLIWDFRGPNAEPIALHHAKHLEEYAQTEQLKHTLTGTQQLSPSHFIAFLVVEKQHMNALRISLKPNRGQLYNE